MKEVVVTMTAVECARLQSNRHNQHNMTQHFNTPGAIPVAQPTVSEH